eukprot:XP_003728687.1 PREDICTED: uncharacterized protein LOC100892641 [Strongylocentrotus purpuratus]
MLSITIEWLVGKWRGTIEDVARSRISNQGELKVGEVVHIEHRRGQHEASIVALEKPRIPQATKTRTAVNAILRQKLRQPSRLRRPSRIVLPVVTRPVNVSDSDTDSDIAEDFMVHQADQTSDQSMDVYHFSDMPALSPTLSDQSANEPLHQAPSPTNHTNPMNSHASTDQSFGLPTLSPIPYCQSVDETLHLATIDQSPDAHSHSLEAIVRQLATLQQQNKTLILEVTNLKREFRAMSGLQRKEPPKYSKLSGNQVLIGSPDANITVDKVVYDRCWEVTTKAKDLVISLLKVVYTKEELAAHNFNGGDVWTGRQMVTKRALRADDRFKAIVAQAEVQYPGAFGSSFLQKQLRDSVNNKCRKATQSLRSAISLQ